MSYSLLSLANDTKKNAMQGLRDAAVRETEREANNEKLKAAEQQQTMGAVGAGASIGASVGGPWGAVIGAGVGLIAGELF
ncbi:bacteriocin [Vibrio sp. HA2012]|uniref:bacteriocin n=1 Tax=Vibrio sp. HA2012 TaxID=1971595 RepID=UPI000C2BBB6D|nr:bacteriocin [Vibrio sp. HA2012]PJC87846.1 bacteriocin [Vibrio sp. HA2012]